MSKHHKHGTKPNKQSKVMVELRSAESIPQSDRQIAVAWCKTWSAYHDHKFETAKSTKAAEFHLDCYGESISVTNWLKTCNDFELSWWIDRLMTTGQAWINAPSVKISKNQLPLFAAA